MPIQDRIQQLLLDLCRVKENKYIKNIVLDPDEIFNLLDEAWGTIDDLEHIIENFANYEEEGH